MDRQKGASEIEYITKEAYDRLLQKREYIEKKLHEAERSVGEAVGRRGDWHDNPAYDAAIAEVRYWSSRLYQVENLLRRVRILQDDETYSAQTISRVQIGSLVKIEIDGEIINVRIGGSVEGSFEEGIVSYKSPLGQALLNAKEGETRKYQAPGGWVTVRILRILSRHDLNSTEESLHEHN